MDGSCFVYTFFFFLYIRTIQYINPLLLINSEENCNGKTT